MPRLNTQAWIASARKSPAEDARSQLAARLDDATLRVAVELGTARVRVSDLLSLQPDDIIRLDRSVQSDLVMYVGARPRFQARAGTVAGNRGVQVTAILSDGAPGPTPAHS